MNRKEFLNKLEEILELDDNTLNGNETLLDMEAWDSLAYLSVIAMADEEFDIIIEGKKLEHVSTVSDLIKLVEEYFSE
jgi:acyl carrier protein